MTGGTSLLVGGVAIPVEAAVAGVGAVSVWHGANTLAYIRNNPVKGNRNSPQYHRLSDGEIELLKNAGYDIHELKGGKSASKYDLFKDDFGNIYQKPKSGNGPGEDLGINIYDLE